jgi:hypothetical protein
MADTNGVRCKQCGARNVEPEREDWATPVCFACLPPAKPLPVREVSPSFRTSVAAVADSLPTSEGDERLVAEAVRRATEASDEA